MKEKSYKIVSLGKVFAKEFPSIARMCVIILDLTTHHSKAEDKKEEKQDNILFAEENKFDGEITNVRLDFLFHFPKPSLNGSKQTMNTTEMDPTVNNLRLHPIVGRVLSTVLLFLETKVEKAGGGCRSGIP